MRSLAFFNKGPRAVGDLVGTDTVTAQGSTARTRHARSGDFYPAKTGDLHLATSGDFFRIWHKFCDLQLPGCCSRCEKHALAKQVEVGASEHLPFDHLDSVHGALDRT